VLAAYCLHCGHEAGDLASLVGQPSLTLGGCH
jgi:hypothetical protein